MKFSKIIYIGLVISVCGVMNFSSFTMAKNTPASQANDALKKDTVAFEKVKKMYEEFVKLIDNGVTESEMTKFFNTHFDVSKITEKFTGSKKIDAALTGALINYFKFLLNGQVIKQVKDYQLSDEFSQISKKKMIVMVCKLNSKDNNATLDMSVSLLKNSSKILELSFMKSIYLIKGAKTIVDLYCQEKTINYKALKTPEKIKTCSDALNAYIAKQSAQAKK